MPISVGFQSIRDRVVAIVDTTFAETVKLSFLKAGSVDPERDAIEVAGILRVGVGDATNFAGGSSQAWRTRLAAGKAELHLNPETYIGPAIVSGDRVRALQRKGKPWFEVLRVDDRGDNRLILELGEV